MKLFQYIKFATFLYSMIAATGLFAAFAVLVENKTDGDLSVSITRRDLSSSVNKPSNPCYAKQTETVPLQKTTSISVGSCCISTIQVTGLNGAIKDKTATKHYCSQFGVMEGCAKDKTCINMKLTITQGSDNSIIIE